VDFETGFSTCTFCVGCKNQDHIYPNTKIFRSPKFSFFQHTQLSRNVKVIARNFKTLFFKEKKINNDNNNNNNNNNNNKFVKSTPVKI